MEFAELLNAIKKQNNLLKKTKLCKQFLVTYRKRS